MRTCAQTETLEAITVVPVSRRTMLQRIALLLATRGRTRAEFARSGDRLSYSGELLSGPEGEPVGQFLAACFCPELS
jgi:hypothetical protein